MTNSLSQLLDVADKVRQFLSIQSYSISHYQDGCRVSLTAGNIFDPKPIVQMVGDHYVRFYAKDDTVIIIIYEIQEE